MDQGGAMPKLAVVVASTRPGRVGLPVGRWFFAAARAHAKFEVELIDLKEVALPPLDEPRHPRFRQYEHAHTKAWSARIEAIDAFVLVTPEYNYGLAPALVNALDYLAKEWAYKPAAFVSYGGVSGGTRSVEMTKQVLTALKMMAIPESVIIPFVSKQIDAQSGEFVAAEAQQQAVALILDELLRWSSALAPLRTKR